MKHIQLAVLAMTPGIGHIKLRNLINHFGSVETLWQASASELLTVEGIGEQLCNNIINNRKTTDTDKLAQKYEKLGVKIVGFGDDDYPYLLAQTYNPPTVLYYRGHLPVHEKMVAMVGSRRATAYGRNVCQMLAADLAAAGVVVVSGAARGIDSSAHLGALEQGYTIAVVANGVDISYPPENAKLLSRISENGAVVSEYPPGTEPQAGQFPARNRIINGLARGVVVIEAAERSGALITVDFALEEGRDIFAVPGSILSASSKGTNKLIKQGAKLVDCAGDVLDEYGWTMLKEQEKNWELSAEEETVLSALTYDTPITLDDIIETTQLPISRAAYILIQLEFQGLIRESGGQRYLRTARGGLR